MEKPAASQKPINQDRSNTLPDTFSEDSCHEKFKEPLTEFHITCLGKQKCEEMRVVLNV